MMKSSHASSDNRRPPLPVVLGFALTCLVMLVYSSTLGADFVWGDDKLNIYGNPHIRGLDWDNLGWMFSDFEYARRYMPLGWLGWAVNYQLAELSPFSFHLGNLILHAANTCLVFAFLFTLLHQRGGRKPEDIRIKWYCAAVGAALWAIHPLRVEPVAWASGRIYGQAACFLLVSWLAFLKSRECGDPRRRRSFYGLSLLAYAASLLTYPLALGGVVVFFLLDWYLAASPVRPKAERPASGWRSHFPAWLDKWPFVFAAFAILGLTLWARMATSEYLPPPTLVEFPVFDRIMQAAYVWAYYVWRPWWPVALSPHYLDLIDFNPASWKFFISAILVAGLSVVLIWKRRAWQFAAFVWVAYLAMMVPLLGLTEKPHYTNDRYNYIVDIGFAILLSSALLGSWPRVQWRRPVLLLSLLLVAGFAALSMKQVTHWRDTVSLYSHILDHVDDTQARADLLMGLGVFHQERKDPHEAERIYREVLRIDPDQVKGLSNLGDVLFEMGRLQEAEEQYREALRIRPNFMNALQNLGVSLARQGRLEQARREFENLVRAYPNNHRAHHNLSLTLKQLGLQQEAEHHLLEAQRLSRSTEPSVLPAANRR